MGSRVIVLENVVDNGEFGFIIWIRKNEFFFVKYLLLFVILYFGCDLECVFVDIRFL